MNWRAHILARVPLAIAAVGVIALGLAANAFINRAVWMFLGDR